MFLNVHSYYSDGLRIIIIIIPALYMIRLVSRVSAQTDLLGICFQDRCQSELAKLSNELKLMRKTDYSV